MFFTLSKWYFCQQTAVSYAVPALALGGVGSLPTGASRFRGPHSSKKRALQAVNF